MSERKTEREPKHNPFKEYVNSSEFASETATNQDKESDEMPAHNHAAFKEYVDSLNTQPLRDVEDLTVFQEFVDSLDLPDQRAKEVFGEFIETLQMHEPVTDEQAAETYRTALDEIFARRPELLPYREQFEQQVGEFLDELEAKGLFPRTTKETDHIRLTELEKNYTINLGYDDESGRLSAFAILKVTEPLSEEQSQVTVQVMHLSKELEQEIHRQIKAQVQVGDDFELPPHITLGEYQDIATNYPIEIKVAIGPAGEKIACTLPGPAEIQLSDFDAYTQFLEASARDGE